MSGDTGCWAGASALPQGVRKTDVDFHSPSGNTPCLPKSGFPDSLAPRHACSRLRGSLLQGGILTLVCSGFWASFLRPVAQETALSVDGKRESVSLSRFL